MVGERRAFQRGARPPAQMPICAVSHLGSDGGGRGRGARTVSARPQRHDLVTGIKSPVFAVPGLTLASRFSSLLNPMTKPDLLRIVCPLGSPSSVTLVPPSHSHSAYSHRYDLNSSASSLLSRTPCPAFCPLSQIHPPDSHHCVLSKNRNPSISSP